MTHAGSGRKRDSPPDLDFMRRALRLARQGQGLASPNPAVGAVLVRDWVLGTGWHKGPGRPHAEIEAMDMARRRGHSLRESTLYVTLEPCSTTGRTPPCTDAIVRSGISRVVVAAVDPNPRHRGRGLALLRRAGIRTEQGLMEGEAERINPGFNHWIGHHRPLVTLKAAMTLDGKIATANGESRWISGKASRRLAMRLRLLHDAVLIGIGTVLADNPSLTVRQGPGLDREHPRKRLPRFVLDRMARTPPECRLCTDAHREGTTIVVGPDAPAANLAALRHRVRVWQAPAEGSLSWLLERMGTVDITSLLVEGGGQVHAAFLEAGLAHRIAFFYAPMVLGGSDSIRAVSGRGRADPAEFPHLEGMRWRTVGSDLLLTASITPR